MSYYTLYLFFRVLVVIAFTAGIGFGMYALFFAKKDRASQSIAVTVACICVGLTSFAMGLPAGEKHTQMIDTWNDAKPVCIIAKGIFPDKLTSVFVYVRDKDGELHLKKFDDYISGMGKKTHTYAFTDKNDAWSGTQDTISYSDTLKTGVTWVLPKQAIVDEYSDLAKRTTDEYLTQIAEENT